MFFYISLGCWLLTMISSFSEGHRKLPALSLAFGLITLWLIYSRHQSAVGMSILAALAIIVFLGSKLNSIKEGH